MGRRPASALAVFLAGLQAGMIAVLWMLAWMGVSAMWQRRSFWSAENLMASVLAGSPAIRNGFRRHNERNRAHLLIYSRLGAASQCWCGTVHPNAVAGHFLFGWLVLFWFRG
jgi:hypothetical protein